MSEFDCIIRPMEFTDIESVIDVHVGSFQSFFLTFLGAAFLRELYAATLADSSGIGFVAEDGEGICGFVTGTTQPAGFYRHLLQRQKWAFTPASDRASCSV